MSDDKSKAGGALLEVVFVDEACELRDWANIWGALEHQVGDTVTKVRVKADDTESQLID